MKIANLLMAFCLGFCSSKKNVTEKAEPSSKVENLKALYNSKVAKLSGWPSTRDCDALLWAGLAKAAGVKDIDLKLAEYDDSGELNRRPKPSCYPGESKSSVSRDMVLGFLWGVWRSSDKDALNRFQSRTEQKNWVIGAPYPERIGETLMTGNLIGLLGRMSCELSKNCPLYRKIEPVHSKSPTDYIQHLTVLFILLNGEVWGTRDTEYDKAVSFKYPGEVTQSDIKESDLDILGWHYEQNKKDALFSAAWHLYKDGNFDEPIDLLMSDDYAYPSYVRGSDAYRDVHWLFVARLLLRKYNL